MTQNLWMSYSEVPVAGHFIWEVIECEGITEEDVKRWPNTYLPTLDGSYIYVTPCIHIWDDKKAWSHFWTNAEEAYNYIRIEGDGPVPF